jgi:tetratricopeptide (TPR) repeat protein
VTAADQEEGSVVPGTVDDIQLTRSGLDSPTGQSRPPAGGGSRSQAQVPAQLSGRVREWYVRAAEHHNRGRPDRAAELLISALTLEPSFACLREALARAQYDARQYLAARTTFTAMTAIDPRDHYALFGLGLVETRLGAHAAAVRHLERAVRLHPGEPRYELALEHARVTSGRAGSGTGGTAGTGGTGTVLAVAVTQGTRTSQGTRTTRATRSTRATLAGSPASRERLS